MSKVMIIGGHGKVAQLATPLLVQAGHTVTSIIRNPGQEDTIRTLGAIPMVFDIEQA
ncbi:NAD-dependent dehydratase, partial [Staphylococcus aureus]